jgi:hydrogenase-4 component E
MFATLAYDLSHLTGATVLLAGFVMLYQRRLLGVFRAFAAQSWALAAAAAWQASSQDAPHLYITAAIALGVNGIAAPLVLNRIVRRLDIHRTVETAVGIGATMLAAMGLVALSTLLVLPVTASSTALTRETLAIALSVVLIGLLVMSTRRNAVIQVVGFISIENGLTLAAVGIKGMPLVVEMTVAFSLLIAFILFGMVFFRIRERFDTLDLPSIEGFRGERR